MVLLQVQLWWTLAAQNQSLRVQKKRRVQNGGTCSVVMLSATVECEKMWKDACTAFYFVSFCHKRNWPTPTAAMPQVVMRPSSFQSHFFHKDVQIKVSLWSVTKVVYILIFHQNVWILDKHVQCISSFSQNKTGFFEYLKLWIVYVHIYKLAVFFSVFAGELLHFPACYHHQLLISGIVWN